MDSLLALRSFLLRHSQNNPTTSVINAKLAMTLPMITPDGGPPLEKLATAAGISVVEDVGVDVKEEIEVGTLGSMTMIGAVGGWDVATDVADWAEFVVEIGSNALDCDDIVGIEESEVPVGLASNCMAVEGVYRM